jgi:hypothetical protein
MLGDGTLRKGFGRVHDQKVVSHVAFRADRRAQKSSNLPRDLQQRRAMMALAPRTVQCMSPRFRRVTTMSLHPASTTTVETTQVLRVELRIAHPVSIALDVFDAFPGFVGIVDVVRGLGGGS